MSRPTIAPHVSTHLSTDPTHDSYMRAIAPEDAPLGHVLFDELSGRRIWITIHPGRFVSDVSRRYGDFAGLMTAYELYSGRWRIRACKPGEQAELFEFNRQLIAA